LKSDIVSALGKGNIEVPVGHAPEYWKSGKRQALEIFANISSIDVLGLYEQEELLKPLIDAYKEIING